MSNDALKVLLAAAEVAAFERSADGSFSALAEAPPWFRRLAGTTFPFLGHVLDEANAFWQSGTVGTREWGPSVETDDAGREFHYLVTAVAAGDRQFLLFRLDRGSDRVREVLQKVRDEKLAGERERQSRAKLAAVGRQASDEVHRVIGQLVRSSPTPEQRELLERLSSLCSTLVGVADQLS
jgi:hypothetical protein